MTPDYNPPSAWYGHENFLHWLLVTTQPHIFVEVGVHHGFSYFVACQTVKAKNTGTICYGVDTWKGDEHTVYDPEGHPDLIYETVKRHNEAYKAFSSLIRKPSVKAAGDFHDRSVELLHIDAGHTYEAIKDDFFAWIPKMRKGGIILIHDTVCMGPGLGVNEFYNEIKDLFPSFNMTNAYGLGVLTIDRYPA